MNELPSLPRPVTSLLDDHDQKGLLRFLTCGSVDDGKSTLIGRLLHDTKLVLEDQVLLLFEELQRVHQELQVVVNPLVVQTLFTYLTRRGRIKHNGTFR